MQDFNVPNVSLSDNYEILDPHSLLKSPAIPALPPPHRFVDASTLNSRPDERAGRPRDDPPPSQSSSADVFLMKPLKIHERLRPARLATIQRSNSAVIIHQRNISSF